MDRRVRLKVKEDQERKDQEQKDRAKFADQFLKTMGKQRDSHIGNIEFSEWLNRHTDDAKRYEEIKGYPACAGFFKATCTGPHWNDCPKDCPVYDPKCPERKTYFLQIPHYIIEGSLRKVSPGARAMFLWIAQQAGFAPAGKDYGKAWLTHEQISAGTGIGKKSMQKYDKELKQFDLIDLEVKRVSNKTKTGVGTIHKYTVKFYSTTT